MIKYYVGQPLDEDGKQVITKDDLAKIQEMEYQNLNFWASRAVLAANYINETNKFFREYGTQWGRRPGVNTGNGKLEARIPEDVLFMKIQEDPGFLQDEVAWNRWLNANPQYKI